MVAEQSSVCQIRNSLGPRFESHSTRDGFYELMLNKKVLMLREASKEYGIDRSEVETLCRYSNSRAPGGFAA